MKEVYNPILLGNAKSDSQKFKNKFRVAANQAPEEATEFVISSIVAI